MQHGGFLDFWFCILCQINKVICPTKTLWKQHFHSVLQNNIQFFFNYLVSLCLWYSWINYWLSIRKNPRLAKTFSIRSETYPECAIQTWVQEILRWLQEFNVIYNFPYVHVYCFSHAPCHMPMQSIFILLISQWEKQENRK